jgi:4a-hydroxytetrahydrobiopterin dehydratase
VSDVLGPDALRDALAELDGWSGTTDGGIAKTYERGDFAGAMAFANRVAAVAEALQHHPDIEISWATVTLRIISHARGGVTRACVELARAIDGRAA